MIMAIPTTQKECTTRRIAALIIGLWDKIKKAFLSKTSRGAANGVASLDANGKVPTSQLPKIGTSGIEDDAITAALVKDGETLPVNISGSGQLKEYTLSNGTYLIGTLGSDTLSRYGGVVFLATTRDYQDLNNVFLIYLQRGRYVQGTPDDTITARATIIDGRVHSANSDGLGFYYNALSDKSTEFYIKVGSSQFVTISLLSDVNRIFNIIEPTSTSLPSGATEFSYYNNVLMTPGQKGGNSVPVYVDNNGYIVECSKVASLDSNGKVPTGNLPSNLNEYTFTNGTYLFGQLTADAPSRYGGAVFLVTTRDTDDHNSTFLLYLQRGSENHGDTTSDIVGTAIMIAGRDPVGPLSDVAFYHDWRSNKQTDLLVKVGSSSFVTIKLLNDLNGCFSIRNLSASIPSAAKLFNYFYNVKTAGQKGSSSVPVYVDANGTIQACTNFPVIEHETSIPVNPTVGTIYAL